MRKAVIVDAVRSPIGRRRGALADIHPGTLSGHVLTALAQRTGLNPADVEDVIWGCVTQSGEQSGNVARVGALAAGWPETVPGTTVDRKCGSGQQAVQFAAASIVAGHCDVAVAGGVESMTRVPMGSNAQGAQQYPQSVLDRFGVEGFSQGRAAEMVASKWALSRAQLDDYAARSHSRAAAAVDSGVLAGQLAPLPGILDVDEGIRRGTSVGTLASLKPAFQEDGCITAGNSSQISDGAGALLLMAADVARERGYTPLACIRAVAVTADDPVIMLTAPITATAKVLRQAGLALSDVGAFEVNEAFASVPLAWQAETGVADSVLNPLGGAIATGHPLGGSGAILMTRLVHHMAENGIRYGLQTMCEAGGQANATILELLD